MPISNLKEINVKLEEILGIRGGSIGNQVIAWLRKYKAQLIKLDKHDTQGLKRLIDNLKILETTLKSEKNLTASKCTSSIQELITHLEGLVTANSHETPVSLVQANNVPPKSIRGRGQALPQTQTVLPEDSLPVPEVKSSLSATESHEGSAVQDESEQHLTGENLVATEEENWHQEEKELMGLSNAEFLRSVSGIHPVRIIQNDFHVNFEKFHQKGEDYDATLDIKDDGFSSESENTFDVDNQIPDKKLGIHQFYQTTVDDEFEEQESINLQERIKRLELQVNIENKVKALAIEEKEALEEELITLKTALARIQAPKIDQSTQTDPQVLTNTQVTVNTQTASYDFDDKATQTGLDDEGNSPLLNTGSTPASSSADLTNQAVDSDSGYISALSEEGQRIDSPNVPQQQLDTALLNAVRKRNDQEVERLLASGASVDAQDDLGQTPLHHAELHHDLNMTQLLLAKGADPNINATSDGSPLHRAIQNENSEIAEYLLSRGADIHIQNDKGNTPLHEAAYYNSPDMIRLLIKHDVNPSFLNRDGKTALAILGKGDHSGVSSEEARNLLLKQEADYQHSLNADLRNAVQAGDSAAIKLLEDIGAHVDEPDVANNPLENNSEPYQNRGAALYEAIDANANPQFIKELEGYPLTGYSAQDRVQDLENPVLQEDPRSTASITLPLDAATPADTQGAIAISDSTDAIPIQQIDQEIPDSTADILYGQERIRAIIGEQAPLYPELLKLTFQKTAPDPSPDRQVPALEDQLVDMMRAQWAGLLMLPADRNPILDAANTASKICEDPDSSDEAREDAKAFLDNKRTFEEFIASIFLTDPKLVGISNPSTDTQIPIVQWLGANLLKCGYQLALKIHVGKNSGQTFYLQEIKENADLDNIKPLSLDLYNPSGGHWSSDPENTSATRGDGFCFFRAIIKAITEVNKTFSHEDLIAILGPMVALDDLLSRNEVSEIENETTIVDPMISPDAGQEGILHVRLVNGLNSENKSDLGGSQHDKNDGEDCYRDHVIDDSPQMPFSVNKAIGSSDQSKNVSLDYPAIALPLDAAAHITKHDATVAANGGISIESIVTTFSNQLTGVQGVDPKGYQLKLDHNSLPKLVKQLAEILQSPVTCNIQNTTDKRDIQTIIGRPNSGSEKAPFIISLSQLNTHGHFGIDAKNAAEIIHRLKQVPSLHSAEDHTLPAITEGTNIAQEFIKDSDHDTSASDIDSIFDETASQSTAETDWEEYEDTTADTRKIENAMYSQDLASASAIVQRDQIRVIPEDQEETLDTRLINRLDAESQTDLGESNHDTRDMDHSHGIDVDSAKKSVSNHDKEPLSNQVSQWLDGHMPALFASRFKKPVQVEHREPDASVADSQQTKDSAITTASLGLDTDIDSGVLPATVAHNTDGVEMIADTDTKNAKGLRSLYFPGHPPTSVNLPKKPEKPLHAAYGEPDSSVLTQDDASTMIDTPMPLIQKKVEDLPSLAEQALDQLIAQAPFPMPRVIAMHKLDDLKQILWDEQFINTVDTAAQLQALQKKWEACQHLYYTSEPDKDFHLSLEHFDAKLMPSHADSADFVRTAVQSYLGGHDSIVVRTAAFLALNQPKAGEKLVLLAKKDGQSEAEKACMAIEIQKGNGPEYYYQELETTAEQSMSVEDRALYMAYAAFSQSEGKPWVKIRLPSLPKQSKGKDVAFRQEFIACLLAFKEINGQGPMLSNVADIDPKSKEITGLVTKRRKQIGSGDWAQLQQQVERLLPKKPAVAQPLVPATAKAASTPIPTAIPTTPQKVEGAAPIPRPRTR